MRTLACLSELPGEAVVALRQVPNRFVRKLPSPGDTT